MTDAGPKDLIDDNDDANTDDQSLSLPGVLKGNFHDFHLSFFKMVGERLNITIVIKRIRVYGFGEHCLNIRDVCIILNHVTRSITLSLFTLRA